MDQSVLLELVVPSRRSMMMMMFTAVTVLHGSLLSFAATENLDGSEPQPRLSRPKIYVTVILQRERMSQLSFLLLRAQCHTHGTVSPLSLLSLLLLLSQQQPQQPSLR